MNALSSCLPIWYSGESERHHAGVFHYLESLPTMAKCSNIGWHLSCPRRRLTLLNAAARRRARYLEQLSIRMSIRATGFAAHTSCAAAAARSVTRVASASPSDMHRSFGQRRAGATGRNCHPDFGIRFDQTTSYPAHGRSNAIAGWQWLSTGRTHNPAACPSLGVPRSRLQLNRGFQPTFDVQQHPGTIRVLPDRFEQELMRDRVEIGPDVEFEHEGNRQHR